MVTKKSLNAMTAHQTVSIQEAVHKKISIGTENLFQLYDWSQPSEKCCTFMIERIRKRTKRPTL